MRDIVIVAHDIRSTHNVGSLLRTAEGLGVNTVYLTGYTPYPKTTQDERLPHISNKLDMQISKTALGAEHNIHWEHSESVIDVITSLKNQGYILLGLEQNDSSILLPDYSPPIKVAVLLGREVEGLDDALRKICDVIVEIPMYGRKESFNVVQAAAICLYALREA